MQILVIDDDSAIGTIIKEELADYHDIICADSGEEGLIQFNKYLPDLVFVDLKMPGMNGVEVVEKLRAHPHNCSIVILTAYEERAAKIEDQVEGVLIKPFDTSKLLRIISNLLAGLADRIECKLQGREGADGQETARREAL